MEATSVSETSAEKEQLPRKDHYSAGSDPCSDYFSVRDVKKRSSKSVTNRILHLHGAQLPTRS